MVCLIYKHSETINSYSCE